MQNNELTHSESDDRRSFSLNMTEEIIMLEIQKTLVSLDLIEKNFVCDLNACKGVCCVIGDSGAPITSEEQNILEQLYPIVREYMTPEGVEAVESQGWYVFDSDGDCVTPLIGDDECAYTYKNSDGITMCAFEKAFHENKIDFLKPISCHLYPVRITKYEEYEAVNYEKNGICKSACEKGEKLGTSLFMFLEQPLTRAYGKEWFKELKIAAETYSKQKE